MKEQIKARLAQIKAPGGEGDLISAEIFQEIELEGGELYVMLRFKSVEREERHRLENEVRSALDDLEGIEAVYVESEVEEQALPQTQQHGSSCSHGEAHQHSSSCSHGGGHHHHAPEPASSPLDGVHNLLAVASGKGGVGKSTVAVNLALALKAQGARVGICDIDVYGPSVPIQMGVPKARPGVTQDQKRFKPIEAYGLPVMSIGFLVDDDTPVIWRGPIVASVVKQFLADVEWGVLDYLVIDLPPGTGDAQLTLTQSAPITGALIVTTPSELALVDAVKGLQMFRKVEVPVIGIVENMSHYICPNCAHESRPFNQGGTERISEKLKVPVLAQIPINDEIQRGSDQGKPVVAINPDSPQSQAFLKLAEEVMGKMPIQGDEQEKKGFLKGLFKR